MVDGSADDAFGSMVKRLGEQLTGYMATPGFTGATDQTKSKAKASSVQLHDNLSAALMACIHRYRNVDSKSVTSVNSVGQLLRDASELYSMTFAFLVIVIMLDAVFAMVYRGLGVNLKNPAVLGAFLTAAVPLQNPDPRVKSKIPPMLGYILARQQTAKAVEKIPKTGDAGGAGDNDEKLSPAFWYRLCEWYARNTRMIEDGKGEAAQKLEYVRECAANLFAGKMEFWKEDTLLSTVISRMYNLAGLQDVDNVVSFPAALCTVYFLYFICALLSGMTLCIRAADRIANVKMHVNQQLESGKTLGASDDDFRTTFHHASALLGGLLLASIRLLTTFEQQKLPLVMDGNDPALPGALEKYLVDIFDTAACLKLTSVQGGSVKTQTYRVTFDPAKLQPGALSSLAVPGPGPQHRRLLQRIKQALAAVMSRETATQPECSFAKYYPQLIKAGALGPAADDENPTRRVLAHLYCLARVVECVPSVLFMLSVIPGTPAFQEAFQSSEQNSELLRAVLDAISVEESVPLPDALTPNGGWELMDITHERDRRMSTSSQNGNQRPGVIVKMSELVMKLFSACTEKGLADDDATFTAFVEHCVSKIERFDEKHLPRIVEKRNDFFAQLMNEPAKVVGYVKVGNRGTWSRRFNVSTPNAKANTPVNTFRLTYSLCPQPVHKYVSRNSTSVDLYYDGDGDLKEKNNEIKAKLGDSANGVKPIKRPITELAAGIDTKDYIFGPFRRVFVDPKLSAKDMAKSCMEVVDMLERGQSVMVFGFGVSGAGKTSTLVKLTTNDPQNDQPGLMQMWYEAFLRGKLQASIDDKILIFVTELYLGSSRDSAGTGAPPMMQVTNTVEVTKSTPTGDVMNSVIEYIDDKRVISPTSNNPISSRSHVIISVMFQVASQTSQGGKEAVFMHIADLAGSENAFNTQDKNQVDRFVDLLKSPEPKVAKLFNRVYGNGITNPLGKFEVELTNRVVNKKVNWEGFDVPGNVPKKGPFAIYPDGTGLKYVSADPEVDHDNELVRPPLFDITVNLKLTLVNALRTVRQKLETENASADMTLEKLPPDEQRVLKQLLKQEFTALYGRLFPGTDNTSAQQGGVDPKRLKGLNKNKKNKKQTSPGPTDHSNIATAAEEPAADGGPEPVRKTIEVFMKAIRVRDLSTMKAFFAIASTDDEEALFSYLWWVCRLYRIFHDKCGNHCINKDGNFKMDPANFQHYVPMLWASLSVALGIVNKTTANGTFSAYGNMFLKEGSVAVLFDPNTKAGEMHPPTSPQMRSTVQKYVKKAMGILFKDNNSKLADILTNEHTPNPCIGACSILTAPGDGFTVVHEDTFTLAFTCCKLMCRGEKVFDGIVMNYMDSCTKEGELINYELECIKRDLVNSVKNKLAIENPLAKPYFVPECASAVTHPILGEQFSINSDDMDATCESIIFKVAYNLSYNLSPGDITDMASGAAAWYSRFVKRSCDRSAPKFRFRDQANSNNSSNSSNQQGQARYIAPVILCVMNLDASIKDPPTPFLDINGMRHTFGMLQALTNKKSPCAHLDVDVLCALNALDSTAIKEPAAELVHTLTTSNIVQRLWNDRFVPDARQLKAVADGYKENETQSMMEDVDAFMARLGAVSGDSASVASFAPEVQKFTDLVEKFSAKSIVGNTLYVDTMCKYGSPASCFVIPNTGACGSSQDTAWRNINNDKNSLARPEKAKKRLP
jgi:hypothetical protein